MRLTNDDAMKLIDQFTDYVEGMIGEDVKLTRNPDMFSVELLRKQKRLSNQVVERSIHPLDHNVIIGGPGSRMGTYTLEVPVE